MSIKQDRIQTRTSEDLRRRLNVTEIAEAGEKVDASVEQVQKLSNQVAGLNNSVKNTRETYISTNEQNFAEDQKERARRNIGAVGEETDPTVPSHVKNITIQDINNWNSGTGGGGGTTSIDTLPVGSIFEYDGSTVPDGYIEVVDENEYSTAEQRIGTWIDGKPLYRKVVSQIGFSNGITSVEHNISNVDMIWIENAFMTAYGQTQMLPLYLYNSATETDPVSAKVDKTNFQIITNSGWGNWTVYAILHYTKTTD